MATQREQDLLSNVRIWPNVRSSRYRRLQSESDALQRQNLGLVAQESSAELDDAVGDRVKVSGFPGTEVLEELFKALDEAIPLLAGVVVGLA